MATQAELDAATALLVPKSLYDANTVLAANTDDTPAAVTMAASTILARLASGNIKAATPAELRTLLALVVDTDIPSLAGTRFIRHTAGATLYYTAPQGAVGASQSRVITQSQIQFVPFFVQKTIAVDRIGMGIWSGVASSVMRLGIYRDNGSGKPGALIVDAGTVATSGSGTVEITISVSLTPDLYWLAACSQGAAANMRAIPYVSPCVGDTLTSAVTNAANIWAQSGVTGALPDPAGTLFMQSNSAPLIGLRVT